MKLGDGDDGSQICLVNKNLLIVERNSKFVLIDVNKRSFIKEIKIEESFLKMMSLNEKTFLTIDRCGLCQYEIEYSNKISYLRQEKLSNDRIIKYPDNKLLAINDDKIYIFG